MWRTKWIPLTVQNHIHPSERRARLAKDRIGPVLSGFESGRLSHSSDYDAPNHYRESENKRDEGRVISDRFPTGLSFRWWGFRMWQRREYIRFLRCSRARRCDHFLLFLRLNRKDFASYIWPGLRWRANEIEQAAEWSKAVVIVALPYKGSVDGGVEGS